MATKRATSNDIYEAYLLSKNGAVTLPVGCRALLAHYLGKSKGTLLSKQELLTETKRLMGDSERDRVKRVAKNSSTVQADTRHREKPFKLVYNGELTEIAIIDGWTPAKKIDNEWKALCIECSKEEVVCCDSGTDHVDNAPVHFKPICVKCHSHLPNL